MGKNTAKKEARKAPSAKKIILTCAKCGKEFIAEAKTRPPKHCEDCRKNTTWRVVGYEDTKYGKVRVEEKGGKIRKILIE